MDEIDRPAVDMDLLAASLRADSSDLSAFVESLAAKLEEAMPGRVRVERRRAGMFGPKLVQSVSVDLGDRRLELRTERGAVRDARRAAVGRDRAEEARCSRPTRGWPRSARRWPPRRRRSETTRQALERLLIQ